MKAYSKPKIRKIALDSEQAILQVCQVSGDYFAVGSFCVGTRSTTHGPCACNITIRGITTRINNGAFSDSQPS